MTITRIVLDQGGSLSRFLKFEALADGSLLIVIDRDPTPKQGGLRLRNGVLEPNSDGEGEVLHHGKFTCHITGQINRHVAGAAAPEIIYGEPLFDLTQPQNVGFYSIPTIAKLDRISPEKLETTDFTVSIPGDVFGRLTCGIALYPNDYSELPPDGIRLRYELYTLHIGPFDIALPEEMRDHFVVGGPKNGSSDHRQIDIPNAELSFYKKVFRDGKPIFRERSGAYVLLAEVPMRVPPELTIKFDSPKFSAEQIEYDGKSPTTHKVRFWIKDKGGRNKKDDLREHIVSVILDAEL